MNNDKMPVLFIGHGSPMNIIEDNSYTRSLRKLGNDLPRPKAILVISAHWLLSGTAVTCTDHPKTIHDFSGFPDELYDLRYPSPGAPEEAAFVVEKLGTAVCGDWGLDHASWAVLKHMYPAADVPVFEMSLDYTFNEWNPKPLDYYYAIGRRLAPLRKRGVLIIGSGNIVHNLGMLDFEREDAPVFSWAGSFDEKVKACLVNRDHEALMNYHKLGKESSYAVPTLDHYLPMIYAIALQEKNEPLTFTHEGFQHGSISMRCFRIG